MLVGLVSDSHDNAPLVGRVVSFLRQQQVDLVLHLGDITTPETVRAFEGLPMRFLRGNNDKDPALDSAMERCGFPPLAISWRGELAGVNVGATHGHLRPRLGELRRDCDVVLSGHTHKRRAQREDGTLLVNPGALHRATVRTIAFLTLPDQEIRFFDVGDGDVTPLLR